MNIFAKSLAPVLGYPEAELVRWLEAVYQKIAEELVLSGEARLADLGILRRVHVPSEPREVDGKLMLVPPRHEVRFIEKDVSEGGVVYEVAIEQLQLEEDVAQKFSKGFARVVEKVVEVRGSLQMGELGEFMRGERGSLMFKQSPILSELLDKPFAGLAPVTISERREPVPLEVESATVKPVHTEPSVMSTPPVSVEQDADVVSKPEQESFSDADTSFLKSPSVSLQTQSTEQEEELPSFSPSVERPQREPLFIALAAAARASLEPENESISTSRKSTTTTAGNATVFRYEAAVPTNAPRKSLIEEALSQPTSPSTEDTSDTQEEDKEGPVLRNIALATAIVFFTIIISFIVMKYESISFTPAPPPAPVDRAKIEAEKAAAARAEAERILAEQSIPRKSADSDSTIKVTGTILKNITKAAKTLPKELTTIDLSKGGYTIIVASQPTREMAAAIVEEFGKFGLAAAVMEKQVGKTIRYRVRIGQFATATEANAAKKKYRDIIPSDAFLDKVKPPAE
jgi:hypothetical protein